jgi:protein-tyrosine phosphatase
MPAAGPVFTDDRLVALTASCNTRDLGGLPLAQGGTTARGVLIRSDLPLELSEPDRRLLARLGVTTVVDLREPLEHGRDPSAFADLGFVTLHLVDVWHGVRDGDWPLADPWDLRRLYLAAIDRSGEAFASAIRHLAAADGAAVFHCTAGKDRTGLLAALVLESVGVPREAVIADYALTHECIDPIRRRLLDDAERRGVRREDFVRLLDATPDILAGALEHLDRRFGGATTYLLGAGLEQDAVDRLRARLVAGQGSGS